MSLRDSLLAEDSGEAVRQAYEAGRKSRPTTAPQELADFLDHLRTIQTRTAKGEFVASDGTRMPYDVAFERPDRTKETP